MSKEIFEYEIPLNWALAISSQILDIRDGTHDSPKYITSGGIPLITSKNLKDARIDFTKVNYISESDHLDISKRSGVEYGDILFAMIGTIGNPVVIKKSKNFSIKNVALFRKNEKVILPELLRYFLSSRIFDEQIAKRKLLNGTTQKFIPLGNLRNLILPIPPLSEQHRIVSKIEELFSSLDKGVESLKLAQQQLKVYRQAVLKSAFEGKLTNENVKDGTLPEKWTIEPLSKICKIVGGVTKGRDLTGKDTIVLPYLRVANVQDGYLQLNEVKTIEVLRSDLEKYRLIYGDILYTEGGDRDKLGRGTVWKEEIENCIHQNHIFRARPISGDFNSKYITYFSQTKTAKDYFFNNGKQTTNLASINMKILSNLLIPHPSDPDLQEAIVSEIESRLSICDKIEESIEQSLQQAEALRQSILKKAFEGKLVPQDLDDEPASVLLERIRAEHQNTAKPGKIKKAKKSRQTELVFEAV